MAAKINKQVKKAKVGARKPRYSCYDCGSEVVMDCCGVGFRSLVCCGKEMKKN
jgi:hypothetical protein